MENLDRFVRSGNAPSHERIRKYARYRAPDDPEPPIAELKKSEALGGKLACWCMSKLHYTRC